MYCHYYWSIRVTLRRRHQDIRLACPTMIALLLTLQWTHQSSNYGERNAHSYGLPCEASDDIPWPAAKCPFHWVPPPSTLGCIPKHILYLILFDSSKGIIVNYCKLYITDVSTDAGMHLHDWCAGTATWSEKSLPYSHNSKTLVALVTNALTHSLSTQTQPLNA